MELTKKPRLRQLTSGRGPAQALTAAIWNVADGSLRPWSRLLHIAVHNICAAIRRIQITSPTNPDISSDTTVPRRLSQGWRGAGSTASAASGKGRQSGISRDGLLNLNGPRPTLAPRAGPAPTTPGRLRQTVSTRGPQRDCAPEAASTPPARTVPRPPSNIVSVMWRPLLLGSSHRFGCLCGVQPLRERIESRTQRRDLLLLPVHDITQFDIGVLQERYFRLEPLECIAVHSDSVTIPAERSAICVHRQQSKPNWRYSCTDGQRQDPFPSFGCAAGCSRNALFFSSTAQIKHCEQTSGVARRRRVYLPRSGD
jgi:hypothetical protein